MSEANTKFTSVEREGLLIMAFVLVAIIAIRLIIAYYSGVFDIPYILHLEVIIYASSIVILLLYKNKVDKNSAQNIIISFGIITAVAFVGVMFSDSTAAAVGKWFGTKDKKTETLQFLGWIISGFTAFFGLLVFNRRAAAQDDANELTKKGHDQNRLNAGIEQLAKERSHVQDRFRAAVDHLSNEWASARVASFYEFFYLAKDARGNEDSYAQTSPQTILDILCAHLRLIADTNKDVTADNKNPDSSSNTDDKNIKDDKNSKHPKEEINSLIGVLFSREAENVFGGLNYDLQRVNLTEVDFRKMHNPKANVDFSDAILNKAIFINTNLSHFILQKTDLRGANLEGANLEGVKLQRAKLQGANLEGANLEGAKLQKAKLQGANLEETNLEETNLEEAKLQGAKLQGAKNLQLDQLTGAEYDDKTEFPDDFAMPDD